MLYIINTHSEIHKTVSCSYIHIIKHIWGYINDDVYHNNNNDDDDDVYISSYVHHDAYICMCIYIYIIIYVYMDIDKYNYN